MAANTAKIKPWPQRGYIKDGIYIIQKRIDGHKFHVSTRRDNPAQAEAEYQRFMESPRSYSPAGKEPEKIAENPPVYLTAQLIEDFVAFSADPPDGSRPNSRRWLYHKRLYLGMWAEDLRGVDLRKIDLKTHIFPVLKQRSSRKARIAILKDFFKWLHDAEFGAGLLETNESRCIELDLHVPQARPMQEEQAKWFTYEAHLAVLDRLVIPWMRESVQFLAATGWHVEELARFAAKEDGAGLIEEPPKPQFNLQPQHTEYVGSKVLVTRHKNGSFHRTRVSEDVCATAVSLQIRGKIDPCKLTNKLKEICEGLGLDDSPGKIRVTPGRYRHSVATWLFNEGVPLIEISTFLGHLSPSTTKRFYASLGVTVNPLLDWYARRPRIAAPSVPVSAGAQTVDVTPTLPILAAATGT